MKRLTATLILVLAGSLCADIVTLNDGTRLEGEVKRTPGGYLVTDAAGKQTTVAGSDIRAIELKKSAGTPSSAEQALASLRRSVEGVTDPASAAQRFQSFLAQNPGTPSAFEAKKDLQTWQERVDKHLTRVGDRWVTREQLAELRTKGNEEATELLPAVHGKPAEAAALIDKALAASPNNPALLYLKGVVLYRQNQLVPARKAFEIVEQALPEHAPTHNNLGVVLYQTRAQMPALLEYDKAMLADPGNQQVLDNVAEALHALPASFANNPLTKKVASHFQEQDAALQTKMAAQGLKRFGSQWIPEADFTRIQAAQRAAEEKLDSYKNDATTLQTRLMQIDREIAYDQQVMRSMTQETAYVDVNSGRVMYNALPQRYYELQHQCEALTAEQLLKQRQLQQLPKLTAEAQKAATAQQSFTGKQNIFDERAMPVSPSATQPTTRPS